MKYDLQDIATVSGMPGLFKVLKPTRTGVVLESLDSIKKRVMAQTRHKISILKEISIFTTSAENSVALENVFVNIYKKYNTELSIDHKTASTNELKAFLGEVVSDFDEARVYPSDIKKLISWYKIVAKELQPIKEEKETKKTEVKADEEKKKAAPKNKNVAKKEVNTTVKNPKSTVKKRATASKKG